MANAFESLPIFRDAHAFVLTVYKYTKAFPQDEKFGLVSQLRRASSSVIANVIEGNTRIHPKEVIKFLIIAKGSLEESKYFLLLARDLEYINKSEYEAICSESESVGRQLSGLLKYWHTKEQS